MNSAGSTWLIADSFSPKIKPAGAQINNNNDKNNNLKLV